MSTTPSATGAALTPPPAPVAAFAASLRAERVRLAERLAVVDQVLAGLDELYGDQTPVSAKPAPARRLPRKVRAADGAAYSCEVCGRRFNRPNGLSRHLNQSHGIKGPRRWRPPPRVTTPQAPVTTPPAPVDTTLVLRCSQCGWETPLADDAISDLNVHCLAEHSRSPRDRERQPRAPRPFPAVLANGHPQPELEAAT